jgi:hypothetical protein
MPCHGQAETFQSPLLSLNLFLNLARATCEGGNLELQLTDPIGKTQELIDRNGEGSALSRKLGKEEFLRKQRQRNRIALRDRNLTLSLQRIREHLEDVEWRRSLDGVGRRRKQFLMMVQQFKHRSFWNREGLVIEDEIERRHRSGPIMI